MRRVGLNVLVAALSLLLLGGCSTIMGFFSKPPPPVTAPPAGVVNNNPYQIGPGDGLSVFVYQSPQLSVGSVTVRPDGRISLPLIPDMIAAGRTPTQLSKDIEERLKEYVKEPNVSVIVSGFQGPLNRQIRVIGEATDPLAIPYRDGMTVLDVMIQTKGLTRYAAGNNPAVRPDQGWRHRPERGDGARRHHDHPAKLFLMRVTFG
jgi:polysaccharide export outer membrane protein